jgi:hypothetical protein
MKFNEISTDAIRYWESRRIIFNIVLAVLYFSTVALGLSRSYGHGSVESILNFRSLTGICVLAFLANICYCIAYPVDLFVQSSDFRDTWRRTRWIFFAVGLVIASLLTIAWGLASSAIGVASF